MPSSEIRPVSEPDGTLSNYFCWVCDLAYSPLSKDLALRDRAGSAVHIAAARLTSSFGSTVVWSGRCLGNASHSANSLPLSAIKRSSSSRTSEMRSTRKLRKSFLSSHHAPSKVAST